MSGSSSIQIGDRTLPPPGKNQLPDIVAHAPLIHRFGNVVGWLLEQRLLASQMHVCNIDPNESGDCKAFTQSWRDSRITHWLRLTKACHADFEKN
jgi:hypothetical protein